MITDNTQVVINLLKGIDEITKKYEEKKDILESILDNTNENIHTEGIRYSTKAELNICKSILRDLKELKK